MDSHIFNEMGLLIVKENNLCEHFEPDDSVLVPMRECWCCKWSNFRADGGKDSFDGYSVCNYAGNSQEAVNQ